MNCPKCPSSLETLSVPLEDRSVPGPKSAKIVLEIDRCPGCGGVWFDSDELDKYLDAKVKIPAAPAAPPALNAQLDAKPASCPRCALALVKGPARSNPKITVDSCGNCAGIWVDGAELADAGGESLPFADRLKAMFGDVKPRSQG